MVCRLIIELARSVPLTNCHFAKHAKTSAVPFRTHKQGKGSCMAVGFVYKRNSMNQHHGYLQYLGVLRP